MSTLLLTAKTSPKIQIILVQNCSHRLGDNRLDNRRLGDTVDRLMVAAAIRVYRDETVS